MSASLSKLMSKIEPSPYGSSASTPSKKADVAPNEKHGDADIFLYTSYSATPSLRLLPAIVS